MAIAGSTGGLNSVKIVIYINHLYFLYNRSFSIFIVSFLCHMKAINGFIRYLVDVYMARWHEFG